MGCAARTVADTERARCGRRFVHALMGMMVVVLAPSVVFLASRTEVLAPIIVLRRRAEPTVEEPVRV